MQRPAIALFLSACLSVNAQPPAQNAANGPETNLRFATTTQLVVEDVLIKGKDGKPILGLKPSDFTITEDGKPQKIGVFEFQTLEGDVPPPAVKPTVASSSGAPDKPSVKPLTAIEIAPEKPGALKYRNRRLMVMFF